MSLLKMIVNMCSLEGGSIVRGISTQWFRRMRPSCSHSFLKYFFLLVSMDEKSIGSQWIQLVWTYKNCDWTLILSGSTQRPIAQVSSMNWHWHYAGMSSFGWMAPYQLDWCRIGHFSMVGNWISRSRIGINGLCISNFYQGKRQLQIVPIKNFPRKLR